MNSTTGVPTIGVRCTCLVVMLTYDICLAVTRINCHYMAGPHYLPIASRKKVLEMGFVASTKKVLERVWEK